MLLPKKTLKNSLDNPIVAQNCTQLDHIIMKWYFQDLSIKPQSFMKIIFWTENSYFLRTISFSSNHNWSVQKGKCNFYYSNTWLTRFLSMNLIPFVDCLKKSFLASRPLRSCIQIVPERQIGSLRWTFSGRCRHTLEWNKFAPECAHGAQEAAPETHLSPCTVITFGDKIMIHEWLAQSEMSCKTILYCTFDKHWACELNQHTKKKGRHAKRK